MEDLVESITRGNVDQVKTVLATIAFALAGYQLMLMAVGYGKVKTSFLGPKAAAYTQGGRGPG